MKALFSLFIFSFFITYPTITTAGFIALFIFALYITNLSNKLDKQVQEKVKRMRG